MRRLFMLMMAFWLVVPLGAQAGGFGGKDDPSGVPGQWYVGNTPASVDPAKPVVVFVHGFHSSSNTWWEGNDMYNTAYQNGYQTAFIDVHPDKNMWTNGPVLKQKFEEIYRHFGNKKLVVVAHSKGGIDTQNALVHQGAYPYVSNLITLSSPHHGSQLADLAYSSWTSWLTGILGSQNDATYSLQTGYMKNYRAQTDSHANRLKNPIYTFGGTSWGSFGSALYFGGVYLNSYGSNDGAVTVTSSRLPYGREVRVGSWDHSTVKSSATFNLFKPYLTTTQALSASKISALEAVQHEESSNIYRGGEFTSSAVQEFTVEESATKIEVDWLSEQKMNDIELVSPTGKVYKKAVRTIDEGVFKGAHHHMFQVSSPEAGKWKVQAKHKKSAYFLNVSVKSSLNDDIELQNVTPSSVDVVHSGDVAKADATLNIKKNGKVVKKQQKDMKKNQQFNASFAEEGVYNITADIKGQTKDGKPFERTIVKSIYVDAKGKIFQ